MYLGWARVLVDLGDQIRPVRRFLARTSEGLAFAFLLEIGLEGVVGWRRALGLCFSKIGSLPESHRGFSQGELRIKGVESFGASAWSKGYSGFFATNLLVLGKR